MNLVVSTAWRQQKRKFNFHYIFIVLFKQKRQRGVYECDDDYENMNVEYNYSKTIFIPHFCCQKFIHTWLRDEMKELSSFSCHEHSKIILIKIISSFLGWALIKFNFETWQRCALQFNKFARLIKKHSIFNFWKQTHIYSCKATAFPSLKPLFTRSRFSIEFLLPQVR